MTYKMVALDLDETLLNAEFKISSRNQEAIRLVVEKGVLVTIATGRMYRSAVRYARELKMDLPLILYHGAMIREAVSGEMIRYSPVPMELALEILQFTAEENYHVNLYIDDRLYVHTETDESRFYQTIAPIPVEPVGDLRAFLTQKGVMPAKLSIINRDGRMEGLQHYLEEKYAGRLTVLQSRPHFLEITSMEATKGQALKYLGNMRNIEVKDIVAIGDSYNDIDMLRFAGMGVAMANAPAAVKAAADFITDSNVDDGVATFLERYILS